MRHQYRDVIQVRVLVECADGTTIGWAVGTPDECYWEYLGMPGGSAHARFVVAGEAFQRRITPDSRRIGAALNAAFNQIGDT